MELDFEFFSDELKEIGDKQGDLELGKKSSLNVRYNWHMMVLGKKIGQHYNVSEVPTMMI